MPCSLAEFHFNSVKLGQILQRFAEQCGMGKGAVSRMTGISRDTITNIYNGDTQEVSFEKVFKMCVAFGVPMIAFEKLGVLGEDTDFADKIVMYDTASGEVLPASEVDIKDMPVPDTVVAVAEAVAAVDNPPDPVRKSAENTDYIKYLHQHIDHLTRLLELAITKGASS
jgi:transcriptional regulator with XRE-family HTH domain